MRKIIILAAMSFCISNVQAQLFKTLNDKVNKSAKKVATKVEVKAETTPDRVIDHAANKVETKAESKITNKEKKVNNEVDKTLDKTDSVKIKKQKTEIPKDSVANDAFLMQSDATKKNSLASCKAATPFCYEPRFSLYC